MKSGRTGHLNRKEQRYHCRRQQQHKPQKKEIEAIKKKVRLLANQNSPSEALILLALDELAKTARAVKVEDADIFEELYRQASRNQGKINLVTLVLSVMGVKHQM